MSQSGYTGFRISNHRPKAHIYVFTSNKALLTSINLYWGIRALYYDQQKSTDETFADIENTLRKKGMLKKGDVYITTASTPLHWKQRTNMLKVNVVEEVVKGSD